MLADWLAANRGYLAGQGVVAPPPGLVLARLTEALDKGRAVDPQIREEALLRGLGASGQRRWMVASVPGLLGPATAAISSDGFYARDVARRLYALRTLLPRCKITFLLGIRKPSEVVPALVAGDEALLSEFMPLIGEETLPWARLVGMVTREFPQSRVAVWRHEELAQVWPQVLGEMIGPGRSMPPRGLLEFASLGLNEEAKVRLRSYLASRPPESVRQLVQVSQVFARRFGQNASRASTESVPGWARQQLSNLDHGYETEWSDILGMKAVRAFRPE